MTDRTVNRAKALGLFIGFSLLYFLTRSLWLDEWDCVQFAMGLKEYNLWKGRPHPPGYPLYILFSWLFNQAGLSPVTSLVLVASLAGGALAAIWFLIIRAEFDEPFAWLIALTTGVTPAIWLTATKALTDIPAAAALGAQLLFALDYRRAPRKSKLLWCVLAGALAAGIRPQLIHIALAVLVTALIAARAGWKRGLATCALFFAANAAWFLPVCVMQGRLASHEHGPLAYPRQLYRQWKWRLNKPDVYIAAPGMDRHRLGARIRTHAGNWIRYGLGLERRSALRLGVLLIVAGVGLAIARAGKRPFWTFHLPWSLLLAATVFSFLPEDRRYYVALTPLMWVALLSGWRTIPGGPRGVWLAPLLMACLAAPAVRAGHTVPPPPVQLVQCLDQNIPPEMRPRVWLMFGGCRRHAEWYGHGYGVTLDRIRAMNRRTLRSSAAIFTDNPDFPAAGIFSNRVRVKVAEFNRDPLVYEKHHSVSLYAMVPREALPAAQPVLPAASPH